MDKAAERYALVYQFGLLMGPVRQLAKQVPCPSMQEFRATVAKLHTDVHAWGEQLNQFTIFDSVTFWNERHAVRDRLQECKRYIDNVISGAGSATDVQTGLNSATLDHHAELVIRSLDLVPIEWESRLFGAQTPLSVYFHLHDAISSASKRVHYFDRYLGPDFFVLYLRTLSRTVAVRLITTTGNAQFGVTAVRTVSSLAAQEFADLQLVECGPQDLHDRNLRIDDTIFHLGPSAQHAGTHPTNFTVAASGPAEHDILDQIIAKGRVVQ